MNQTSPKDNPRQKADPNAGILRAAVQEVARELGSSTVTSAVARASWPPETNQLTASQVAVNLQKFHLQANPISAAQIHRWIRPGNIAVGVAESDLVVVSSGSRYRVRETFVDATAVSRRWIGRRRLSREASAKEHQWLAVTKSQDLDDMASAGERLTPWRRLKALARIERRDISIVATYAATLGLLTLIIPIATQALVNTVAFGAIMQPLIVLTVALCFGLAIAGGLSVVQAYIVEVFQRRILVRFAEDLGARIPRVSHLAREKLDLVELNNRFLDVITIQKSATELLLVGLGLALQTGVGLLLLGFYHPALMVFALLLCAGIALITMLGRGGTKSAIVESKTKFAIVAWLDELARAPQLFAGGQGKMFAAERITEKVHSYVSSRRSHYRHVFAVLVGGVALQVIAFVALLGVGGYLVIERQLTLGQLVAAEIVVGAIAVGIGKLGRLADKSFDLVAATDKLGALLDLPLQQEGVDALPSSVEGLTLQADSVAIGGRGTSMPPISFHLQSGQKLHLDGAAGIGKSLLLQALAGHRRPQAGRISWDGRAAPTADALADAVFLASENALIAGSVIDNLRLNNVLLSEAEAWEVLGRVGLSQTVDQLGGLDGTLHSAGQPLSSSQRRRLVLARALVASPRLLLIDGTLDFLDGSDTRMIDLLLGDSAPWSAIVVSHDPRVRAALAQTISADNGGIR